MTTRSLTREQDAAFEKQVDKEMRSQRIFPNGRDFRCFSERFRTDTTETFRDKFDKTFPAAPGSPEWFDQKFGKPKEGKANV